MHQSTRMGLLGGAALATVLALSAGPTLAQTTGQPIQTEQDKAAEKAKAASANQVQELVVVGSRIRRDNFNSPSPVQVVTHEETTMAGFGSTTDALQSTAVTTGQAQINNAFGGFVTN